MSIEILQPGMFTTIQDLGRFGYLKIGMPTSGAMDAFALSVANALVGNDPNAAGLEMTVMGTTVAFERPCSIAIAGADLGPRLNGREIENWRPYLVKTGSVLDFSGRRSGARAYLAVSGGIDVEPWLGSRSTYLLAGVGGLEGRALRAGDRLSLGVSMPSLSGGLGRPFPAELRPSYSGEPTIRVILGPHLGRFTREGVDAFLGGQYEVTPASNRIAYRLQGPQITHTRGPDLISCGVPLGGLQVPGNGQPILHLADHPTMGGYTMIATVIQADIPLLAQLLPGDRIAFRTVEFDEARESLRRQVEAIRSISEERDGSIWGM